jgi:hypothetical protein
MATDGDKMAAAILASKLLELTTSPLNRGPQAAADLYAELLVMVANINPETGKPRSTSPTDTRHNF